MLRPRSLLPLVLPLALLACDKDKAGDKKEADKKSDDKQVKADEAKPEPEPEAPKKLEHPWKRSEVAKNMKLGMALTYKQTGKSIDGKDVEDDYKCVIKSATETDVGTVCNGVNHPSEDKGANEVATANWTGYSPFFTVQNPVEDKLVERAELKVPAGTFDTIQAEISGFMGNSYTVWMIADKPGVYAKVHKHPNKNAEGDQTDLVFELASIE